MKDMLSLSAHLPERRFAPGELVVEAGGKDGAIWILVSGALAVKVGDVLVNTVAQPGALIGENAVLLDSVHGATVEAAEPSVLRQAVDGRAFLESDAAIAMLVAAGLAARLNFVTSYLADLKRQYGDAPGLSMVPEVLRQLAGRPAAPLRPGSAREPDPEY